MEHLCIYIILVMSIGFMSGIMYGIIHSLFITGYKVSKYQENKNKSGRTDPLRFLASFEIHPSPVISSLHQSQSYCHALTLSYPITPHTICHI